MKLLLILLGIYVYFVVGNLVTTWFENLMGFDHEDDILRYAPILLFPVVICVSIGIIIYRKLPKFNIPFTPKKVADLICKIDLKKLVKYRIRIEPKISDEEARKIAVDHIKQHVAEVKGENNHEEHVKLHTEMLEKPECFGYLKHRRILKGTECYLCSSAKDCMEKE